MDCIANHVFFGTQYWFYMNNKLPECIDKPCGELCEPEKLKVYIPSGQWNKWLQILRKIIKDGRKDSKTPEIVFGLWYSQKLYTMTDIKEIGWNGNEKERSSDFVRK